MTIDIDNLEKLDMLPSYMQPGIVRYIQQGIIPGNFLTAIIQNDLKGAVHCADDENIHLLPDYVKWFYNNAPIGCWGSVEKMERWVAEKEK